MKSAVIEREIRAAPETRSPQHIALDSLFTEYWCPLKR